ncbi:Uncharacterised protein [Serratia liquefaciens]|uniref:hypothetical protein n=1 Tax=Serratia TaxID=613 RepID=UPI0021842377|nr:MULTISPECIES: hypothetical protein [Serratia]MDH2272331.1 hypothetical protein [Serratia marcescens]MDH2279424.1 hypothetical protein [Serratia marcescens]CAI2538592.1 Uncharacterised protein [Serratia liquefaciens]
MSEPAPPVPEQATPIRPPPPWWQQIGEVALTAVISAALTCLVLLVVALLFGLKESGSAADWLAVVTNGIVAVGAVGAFVVARRWLPQLTTQEGYKEAIQLVNKHYIWLGHQNSLLKDAGWAMTRFNALQADFTAYGYDAYREAIAPLATSVNNEKKRKDEVERIAFRLNTYGLQFSGRYKTRLVQLEGAFQNAVYAAATLQSYLQTDLNIQHRYNNLHPTNLHMVGTISDLHDERAALKTDVIQAYEALETHCNQMATAHARIFNHAPAIGDLFVVRRR